MRTRRGLFLAATFGLTLALVACDDKQEAAAPPPPQALTASAIGHYCGMNVLEHTGPKGQILLESRLDPVWFSSARDTLAFTMLEEEPKDIRAIYVSDMARAQSWDEPGAENWVNARHAFYVLGSDRQSGMGAPETVPFSDRAAAERFVGEHGGRVVTFEDVPRDYVLGAPPGDPTPAEHGHHAHGEGDDARSH